MPKTLVAVPCMQKVDTDFMVSMLSLERTPDTHFSFLQGSLVYDARNTFAVNAITGDYERIMFIDSDMILPPDALKRLSADMDAGREYVSALAFTRKLPVRPVIYRHIDLIQDEGMARADVESYLMYPRDSLFRIDGSGFGCVMLSVNLIRRVWDRFGPAFMPTTVFGEDLAFCYRAKQLGAEMWCDSAVKVGHIGHMVFDEDVYMDEQGKQSRAIHTLSETADNSNVQTLSAAERERQTKAFSALPDRRKQKRM